MKRDCECEGFADRWSNDREEHYTETIHDEDCPNHPERRAEDEAEHWMQLKQDGELDD